MSVLIKGMEMPEKQTILTIFPNGYVDDAKDSFIGEAKAFPVPKHGRLIDADALTRAQGLHDYKYENGLVYVSVCEVVCLINAAPTIIPASEEGE